MLPAAAPFFPRRCVARSRQLLLLSRVDAVWASALLPASHPELRHESVFGLPERACPPALAALRLARACLVPCLVCCARCALPVLISFTVKNA
jgi:hypothetical protein